MDAQAVSEALSPASLAPPIAKDLGLAVEAVEAALHLLAGGAQPAFVERYRRERIGSLAIRDLERIQARAAHAVAFVFKRQEVAAELAKRNFDAPYLAQHLATAQHEVDLDDLQALFRKRKRGPALKARTAGLTPAAAALLNQAGCTDLAAVATAQIAIDRQRAQQAGQQKPRGPKKKKNKKHPEQGHAQDASTPENIDAGDTVQTHEAIEASKRPTAEVTPVADDPASATRPAPPTEPEPEPGPGPPTVIVTGPGPETGTETGTGPETETETGAETGSGPETGSETGTEPETGTETETETGSGPENAAEAGPGTGTGTGAETGTEPETGTGSETGSETAVGAETAAGAGAGPEPGTGTEPGAGTGTEPGAGTETGTSTSTSTSTSTGPSQPEPAPRPEPTPLFDPDQVRAAIEAGNLPEEAEALHGIRLICGELMAEHPPLRRRLRRLLWGKGKLRSTVVEAKKEKAGRYAKYFDRAEAVKGVASTNVLSLHRGEREGMLAIDIEVDEELVVQAIAEALSIDGDSAAAEQVRKAGAEAWAHGLGRVVKAGIRKELKQRADQDAIGDLCEALRPLLLAPAFGHEPVMGIDAGQQHGCRLVVVDGKGAVQADDTVFPLQPKLQVPQSKARIAELVKEHGVAGIVVGSSGPGREVERLCRQLTREDEALGSLVIASLDTDAASLFASSRAGKDEFPKSEAAFRRAVALARRMQDPLRELVKLDVRKFGLGSHQHDVDQEALRNAFAQVMTSCVSAVTVDVNEADADQLTPVAGLSQALSKAITGLRQSKGEGGFRTRAELLDVPGMAGKAFEQSSGFLRIVGGEQPLDATLVHPERYGQITEMARDLGVTLGDLFAQPELLDKLEPDKYIGKPGLSGEPLGRPSFDFIVDQLRNKVVDPRPPFETVEFNPNLAAFEDLQVGMDLEGIVTHLASFGAFVDVGLAQEGLVHVSELSHSFVNNPLDAVHVGQKIKGRVIEIAPEKKRFSLSVKALLPRPERPGKSKEGHRGKKRKKGDGPRKDGPRKDGPRKGGRDGGKGRREPRKDKALEFRMDLSELAQLLEDS